MYFMTVWEAQPVMAKLLIAEDDIFIRATIAQFLRDAGFDVFEASSTDEAMSVFEAGTEIDLLFSEIRMPGSMDGRELAVRVKDRWPATHIMLTSGYPGALGEVRDRFLPKPYRPLSVLAAILSAVDP
jgi:CheY-like chemotaxis protein